MKGLLAEDFCTVLKSNVVSQLRSFCAEQEGFCRTEQERRGIRFFADKDWFSPVKQDCLPFVNVWTENETPDDKTSGHKVQPSTTVVLNLDLLAALPADRHCTPTGEPQIPVTFRRLDYLKTQVRAALCEPDFYDMGFEPGTIGRRSWPSFTLFKDRSGMPELALVSGRISLDVTYCWDMEIPCTVPIEEISVDARLFGALYSYKQEEL